MKRLTRKRGDNTIRDMSNYRKDVERYAAAFGALSNPHRLEVFLRLIRCCKPGTKWTANAEDCSLCVGDVGDGLGIAPSTLSHHIKEMRNAGLITVRRRGKNVECFVEPGLVAELATLFTGALAGNVVVRETRK